MTTKAKDAEKVRQIHELMDQISRSSKLRILRQTAGECNLVVLRLEQVVTLASPERGTGKPHMSNDNRGNSSKTAKPKAKALTTSDGKTKQKKKKTQIETSPNPLRGTDDFKYFEANKDLQKQLKQRKKAAKGDFPVTEDDVALVERAKKARVDYTKALCKAKGEVYDPSKLHSRPAKEEKKESAGVGNTLSKDDPWADVSSGPSTPTDKPGRAKKKKSSKKTKGKGKDKSPE